MATTRKRSVQIKVTLTPELHEQLAEVARQFGQAPATLCSVWIGQACALAARNLGAQDRAIQEMVKTVGPELRDQLQLIASAEASK